MENGSFGVGKLPPDLLESLLSGLADDPRVLVGPTVGRDAAVLDYGERLLVVKSDPITFATDRIGWYVVHVNANDIACMGAAPRWLLLTVLLPERGATREMAEGMMTQVRSACESLGVYIIGGHTEITYGLDRPILVGHMLGETTRERLVAGAAQVGDVLLMTKGAAIEGTAIIAQEKGDSLLAAGAAESVAAGRRFLDDPGISVVKEAEAANRAGEVHLMHDPTEGGVATGIHEMARLSGVGFRVEEAAVPIHPVTAQLCSLTGLNPLGVIASGALLLAVKEEDAAAVTEAIRQTGTPCARIGQAAPADEGVMLMTAEGARHLPMFIKDEITRLFT